MSTFQCHITRYVQLRYCMAKMLRGATASKSAKKALSPLASVLTCVHALCSHVQSMCSPH